MYSKKFDKLDNIHAPDIIKIKAIPTTFGTNVIVCSFICVAAWNIEIIKPIARLTIRSGAAICKIKYIVSLNTTRILSVLKFSPHILILS